MALRLQHVPAEDGAEGVAVGDPEEAERADHHVHVNGVHVIAEHALRPPGRQDLVEQRDHRPAEVDELGEFLDVLGIVDVLDADEPDEVRMRLMVVDGDLGDATQRGDRVGIVHPDVAFGRADPGVGPLQHRDVELLLAAEVVIDHAFGRPRQRGDVIDPRPVVAAGGELGRRDVEDLGPGPGGVANPVGRRRAWVVLIWPPSGLRVAHVWPSWREVRRPERLTTLDFGPLRWLTNVPVRIREPTRHPERAMTASGDPHLSRGGADPSCARGSTSPAPARAGRQSPRYAGRMSGGIGPLFRRPCCVSSQAWARMPTDRLSTKSPRASGGAKPSSP